MRNPFTPPPSPRQLRALMVHELVRDYPEALPILQRLRVHLPREGGKPVPEALLEGHGAGEELHDALAWRRT